MAAIRCLGHQFSSIQAVLFDKDGTLANVEGYLRSLGELRSQLIATQLADQCSQPTAAQVSASILATFGLSEQRLDPAGLLAVGSRYDNEIAAAACVAANGVGWVESVAVAKTAFELAAAQLSPKVVQTPLLPGALALLNKLAAAGIKVGIVSSDLHTEVAAFIDYYQLSAISWYCGASPTVLAKTHPNFLQFACQSLAIEPAATLIVGDSAADYALAHQGAAGFLGMTGGWQEPPTVSPHASLFSTLDQVEIC